MCSSDISVVERLPLHVRKLLKRDHSPDIFSYPINLYNCKAGTAHVSREGQFSVIYTFSMWKKKKKKEASILQKLSSNWTGKVSCKFQSGNLMEYTTLQVIFDVFNLLWSLVFRDLSIYSGAWIIHNRCGCRCKLIIYLASGVFSHVKTYLQSFQHKSWDLIWNRCSLPWDEAHRWQRNLSPVYRSSSGAWESRSSNDTINRFCIQFNILFCPFTIAVSPEASLGTHWHLAKLCQKGFLGQR